MYIVKSKADILSGLAFAFIGIAAGLFIKFTPYAKTFKTADEILVIVDAGHGLPDGGAVGVGKTVEQEINLKIAKKLREVLEGRGIRVIMTRETEMGLSGGGLDIRGMKVADMKERYRIMKDSGADLFISIHMNFFTGAAINGLRIFYDAKHAEIKPLAEQIQEKMSRVTGAKTTEVKTADKTLFLMKDPPIPAILAECGFLSNREEEKKLNDEDYQSRLAWAIADAVSKYLSDK